MAASRVLFCAVVRVRRPVVFDGDLAAVERVVLRVVVRALRLRVAAAFLAAALRFAADVLLVVVVPVVVAI